MSNHLKKIVARAKQIHKSHPSKKWTDCIKSASAEMRGSKKTRSTSKARRAPARKKAAVRKRAHVSGTSQVSGLQTIAGMKREVKNHYQDRLARALLAKDLATTKREKAKHQKVISHLRKEVRKHTEGK